MSVSNSALTLASSQYRQIAKAVNEERLINTATRLMSVHSPTGQCGEVADLLAELLSDEGFQVQRIEANHSAAPAVIVRHVGRNPGRCLQFEGHLDTVHLPFVPPAQVDGRLTGTGAADMKAGIAAAVEALRVIRELDLLTHGSVLLTAHDLHESPWGDGRQLNSMIEAGLHGDGVLIPEYFQDFLPIVGRGGLIWRVALHRAGENVHEVMRPDEPGVVLAASELIQRLSKWDREIGIARDPLAGPGSVFVGQIHAGELYNQFPTTATLEGTCRWLPGVTSASVEQRFSQILSALANEYSITGEVQFSPMRDAFRLDPNDDLTVAFQSVIMRDSGRNLTHGAKPFVDDGNAFWALAGIPAITHGPIAGGAHTLEEWVQIDSLVCVARRYACTAVQYCNL